MMGILIIPLLVLSTPHDATFQTWIRCDSDSMAPLIDCKDVVYGIYPKNISVGDIIVFRRPKQVDSRATYIIHRVVREMNGSYITKGDNNEIDDFARWGFTVKRSDIRSKIVWIKRG